RPGEATGAPTRNRRRPHTSRALDAATQAPGDRGADRDTSATRAVRADRSGLPARPGEATGAPTRNRRRPHTSRALDAATQAPGDRDGNRDTSATRAVQAGCSGLPTRPGKAASAPVRPRRQLRPRATGTRARRRSYGAAGQTGRGRRCA
ncbi:hypothetical protein ACIREM_41525, partial [Streptomyces shenzhenensis]